MRCKMELLKILIFSGFFVLMGILVWKKNIVDFIAGYKKNVINNSKKLAKNIGIIIILFGVEIGLLMLLNLGDLTIKPEIIGVLAIVHIIAVLLCYIYDVIHFKRLN